jgi:hypothetical protein
MNRVAVVVLFLALTGIGFPQTDEPGSKDHPEISCMPEFYITGYKESEFDGVSFPVTQNGEQTEERIEGRLIRIEYERGDRGPAASRLQILRNLQNAARRGWAGVGRLYRRPGIRSHNAPAPRGR